jgi:hypothetical protein
MTTDEKCEKINELLEEKNVTIQDDYFFDIFRNGDTNEEIFHVTAQKCAITDERKEQILDEVLANLSSYENKSNH